MQSQHAPLQCYWLYIELHTCTHKKVIFLHILINAIFHFLIGMLIRCIDMRNVATTKKILGIHCSLETYKDNEH